MLWASFGLAQMLPEGWAVVGVELSSIVLASGEFVVELASKVTWPLATLAATRTRQALARLRSVQEWPGQQHATCSP